MSLKHILGWHQLSQLHWAQLVNSTNPRPGSIPMIKNISIYSCLLCSLLSTSSYFFLLVYEGNSLVGQRNSPIKCAGIEISLLPWSKSTALPLEKKENVFDHSTTCVELLVINERSTSLQILHQEGEVSSEDETEGNLKKPIQTSE